MLYAGGTENFNVPQDVETLKSGGNNVTNGPRTPPLTQNNYHKVMWSVANAVTSEQYKTLSQISPRMLIYNKD